MENIMMNRRQNDAETPAKPTLLARMAIMRRIRMGKGSHADHAAMGAHEASRPSTDDETENTMTTNHQNTVTRTAYCGICLQETTHASTGRTVTHMVAPYEPEATYRCVDCPTDGPAGGSTTSIATLNRLESEQQNDEEMTMNDDPNYYQDDEGAWLPRADAAERALERMDGYLARWDRAEAHVEMAAACGHVPARLMRDVEAVTQMTKNRPESETKMNDNQMYHETDDGAFFPRADVAERAFARMDAALAWDEVPAGLMVQVVNDMTKNRPESETEMKRIPRTSRQIHAETLADTYAKRREVKMREADDRRNADTTPTESRRKTVTTWIVRCHGEGRALDVRVQATTQAQARHRAFRRATWASEQSSAVRA